MELPLHCRPIVALTMMYYAVTFSLEFGPNLLRSFLTPLFGETGGVSPLERETLSTRLTQTYNVGDEAAKREAIAMLMEGNGEASPQVAQLAEESTLASPSGAQLAKAAAERAGADAELPEKQPL